MVTTGYVAYPARPCDSLWHRGRGNFQTTEAKENPMIEKYYYLRDKQNKPRVTVCCHWANGRFIARGVAICSMKDNPVKLSGVPLLKNGL